MSRLWSRRSSPGRCPAGRAAPRSIAATGKAGRACRRPAASRVSPPSRGSRPKTPAASASEQHAVRDPADRRARRLLCCGDARPARASGGVFTLWPAAIPHRRQRRSRDRQVSRFSGSAGDDQVVADVKDTACHPGSAGHRVVLGPGADVAGRRAAGAPARSGCRRCRRASAAAGGAGRRSTPGLRNAVSGWCWRLTRTMP